MGGIDYYTSAVLRARDIEFRANRLSYVGERGYELYVTKDRASALWRRLVAAGEPLQLQPAGFHAMNACRMEKGYRHWGDDIHDHITPLQAGLGFAASRNKGSYLGKAAIDAQRGPQRRRLVNLAIDDPDPPFMLHDEPIFRDGVFVGLTTSAAWGHRVGKSLAVADITHPDGVTAEWLTQGHFQVEVALKRYPITVQLGAFYDPGASA